MAAAVLAAAAEGEARRAAMAAGWFRTAVIMINSGSAHTCGRDKTCVSFRSADVDGDDAARPTRAAEGSVPDDDNTIARGAPMVTVGRPNILRA